MYNVINDYYLRRSAETIYVICATLFYLHIQKS